MSRNIEIKEVEYTETSFMGSSSALVVGYMLFVDSIFIQRSKEAKM